MDFYCIKHFTYHPCHIRRVKDMNIFHAFLEVGHCTWGSSLWRGWMEVDVLSVKGWMEVDVKWTASLAPPKCSPITFASSPFSWAQKCNMQSAQTSGECTTIMQCSLVQKVHFWRDASVQKSKLTCANMPSSSEKLQDALCMNKRLHCQCLQRSIINVYFYGKQSYCLSPCILSLCV